MTQMLIGIQNKFINKSILIKNYIIARSNIIQYKTINDIKQICNDKISY